MRAMTDASKIIPTLAEWAAGGFVSWFPRGETARPLLIPGEVMQLSPADEIVMVAGTPPCSLTTVVQNDRTDVQWSCLYELQAEFRKSFGE
jgi:hypothetical protein